ncbi:predicted protein [Nematostella vectensis]|uniref:Uncharacterized protein n=1 Tax=Nematostella vectensis TaxID=45351 RepID=A7SUT2_NEMVE|nr:predicted protein [Nematostella vectensis]|eukprot:XP_001624635.1 predicted protein [Nematostella vectensis]
MKFNFQRNKYHEYQIFGVYNRLCIKMGNRVHHFYFRGCVMVHLRKRGHLFTCS